MEVVISIIFALAYFGSYAVLQKKYPEVAKDVAAVNLHWYGDASKYHYFGWLLLGNFIELTRGTNYRVVFEISRVLLVLVGFYLFWRLLNGA